MQAIKYNDAIQLGLYTQAELDHLFGDWYFMEDESTLFHPLWWLRNLTYDDVTGEQWADVCPASYVTSKGEIYVLLPNQFTVLLPPTIEIIEL